MSNNRPSMQPRNSDVERIMATAEIDTTFAGAKTVRYRGRRSTWPGALGLFLLAAGSLFGLIWYGMKLHNDVQTRIPNALALRNRFGSGTLISDGRQVTETEDLQITNPEEYVDKKCEQPVYQTKNGKIVAVFKDGTEVQLDIKGVNWMGMQDNKGVPKGLWDNTREGSTLYRVGQFLSGNNFNMVRLALSIDAALRNTAIETNLINTNSNRALNAVKYNKFIGQVVQGLGQQGLGVVLNFHVLSAIVKDDDSLWYGTSIQLDDIKTAISNLAKELCNSKHFNIVGLDLKDGIGKTATWGDGSKTDWAQAATTLGAHVQSECSQWLVFVGGVQGSAHKDTYEGDRVLRSSFIAGSDLSLVGKVPIQLPTSNKLVYAPKYWSSSFMPQPFFFDDGTPDGDLFLKYKESSDATLAKNVERNMNYSFGAAMKSDAPVVLSSFGGLVGAMDLTKLKTSTRIISILIDKMLDTNKGFVGGFWFTLNPETYWPYPAPDNSNGTASGLVDSTWRAANLDVLASLKKMDKMTSVAKIPCIT